MKTATTAPELVTLKDGLTVSMDALRVLWDLEVRAFDVKLGNGRCHKILVGPAERLTEKDKTDIRLHRDALVSLVRYVENVIV